MASWRVIDPSWLLAMSGPPAVIAIAAGVLFMLPSTAINFLTAWLLASFPIGVLIGHCALNDE